MPRTASTRNIAGDRLRSRPVTPRPARPGDNEARMAAELPPILFRLPDLAPARRDAEKVPTESVPADRFPAEDDQDLLACDANIAHLRDVPDVVLGSSGAVDSSSLRAHVYEATMETFGGPSIPVNATVSETAVVSVAPVAVAPVAVAPVAVSPVAVSPVAVSPVAAASCGPQRTWWEHWSSGVVLILLIIALVTASIVALNDGSHAKPDYLASQAESSMSDEFDLSNITIPEVTIPVESAIVPAAVRADEALKLATTSVPVLVEPAAVLAPRTTLDQPVGVAALQLFASGDSQSNTAPSNAASGVPSMTASNPTVSLELQSAVSATNTTSPAATTVGNSASDGSSPTFYDGASHITQQPTTTGNAAGQALPIETGAASMPSEGFVHSAEGPIDTNMPSYSTIMASATGDVGGVGVATKSVFSTASLTLPTNPSADPSAPLGLPSGATASQYTSQYANPAPTAPTASVVPSATPDLNGNSLVNEFLKFDQMRQAGGGTAENRYPGSTTTAPQPGAGPQSTVSQSPAISTGFTLGNPRN